MLYVLLQPPNDGYLWVVVAGSARHFELEDEGYMELASGSYQEMEATGAQVEKEDPDIIRLYCHETYSEIHTTEECLHQILENDPDYLNNKEFL